MVIAVLLGMVTACEVPDVSNSTTGSTTGGGGTTYTVSFEANGGSPAPQKQTISQGGKATEPAPMNKTGYGFAGWYKEAAFTNLWNFTNDTVTGNTTLYAKWDSYFHTVTFVANGGTPAPQPQNIAHGGKVIKPQNMSKGGDNFEGWYKETAFINQWNFTSDTVTQNIVLYAKWGYSAPPTTVTVSNVPSTTLLQKLQWIASNAASNTNYLVEVNSDEYLAPQTLSYSGKSNITIQLTGIDSVKTITIYGSGSLFTIEGGVTLVLNENILLKGASTSSASLVRVNSSNLIMNTGSKITEKHSGSSSGGGVYVNSGNFTMNGGEISGNAVTLGSGGGVFVNRGNFTMNNGKISDNTAKISSSSYNTTYAYGGGVYVNDGTFTMTGGEISGNAASNKGYDSFDSKYSYGGGVYVDGGTFTMTGGKISGNTAFDTISGSYGGGVYVNRGTFTMTGGEISNNTASHQGGGVYVSSSSSFEKTGGIITGYSSDTVNGNMVKANSGILQANGSHAVYVSNNASTFSRSKGTTSEQGDNLIYIKNDPNPPTISGAWDE